jgi:RNA polymerase sigma factor (sigma-70 family)
VDEDAGLAAARAGDASAFAALVARHRRELRVHRYRMLGSFDESEDLVQETFLRAWRHLAGFEGRSTFRAWLYRIATNACLDGRARRVLPHHVAPSSDARARSRRAPTSRGCSPSPTGCVSRPGRATSSPRPWWSPGRRSSWRSWPRSSTFLPGSGPRCSCATCSAATVETGANRQPAVATYVRGLDEPAHRAFAIAVLRIEDGRIEEITAFHDPGLFPAFALPAALSPARR